MIEVKNVKQVENQGTVKEEVTRFHLVQRIDGLILGDNNDDYGQFVCRIIGKEKNVGGIFDSYEKAERFYNDFLKLLPDSEGVLKSIDIKDYE